MNRNIHAASSAVAAIDGGLISSMATVIFGPIRPQAGKDAQARTRRRPDRLVTNCEGLLERDGRGVCTGPTFSFPNCYAANGVLYYPVHCTVQLS